MSARAITSVEPDRTKSLSVPLLQSRRGSTDIVSVRCDALVQLASGLSGVTPDDVASHLAAGLHDAVDFDVLHIVILEGDPDSAQPLVLGRSTRRGANAWAAETRSRWASQPA